MRASVLVFAALLGLPASGGEKLIQNDTFSGTGPVAAPVAFTTYAGAGVTLTPDPADYPLSLIAVDVMVVPTPMSVPGDFDLGLIDVWDEAPDAGVSPPPTQSGNRYTGGLQLTGATNTFNRFTFPSPIVIDGGRLFIGVRQGVDNLGAPYNTTIAMDNGPVVPNAEWHFDGYGHWERLVAGDAGAGEIALSRNWIIRGVISRPSQPPVVTAISPDAGANGARVDVTVSGDFFAIDSRVFLGTTELAVSSRVPPTTLYAAVPVGLAAGVYDVIVENPGAPPLRGTLPQAYTAIESRDGGTGGGAGGGTGGSGGGTGGAGGGSGGSGGSGGGGVQPAFRLDSVSPAVIWAGDTSDLTVLGAGFDATVQLVIGDKLVDPIDRRSAAVIAATIKPKALAAGVYDVSAINSDGSKATLTQALTVRDGVSVKGGCSCSSPGAGLLAALGLLLLRRRPSRCPEIPLPATAGRGRPQAG